MLARISSASLVQANGCGWSFQWSMKAPMVATSCLTEVNEPRRMAWRVMIEKKHSINRPWRISAVLSGFGGSLKSLQVSLDAGDDACVPGDFGVPAALGGVVA